MSERRLGLAAGMLVCQEHTTCPRGTGVGLEAEFQEDAP